MNLFILVPETLNYLRYITSFCKTGAESDLSNSRAAVVADIGEDTTKKDNLIKDLVRMALDRKLIGVEFDSVFSALESEFSLCGLNNRANFSDFSWFFEFYIKERQSELVGRTEEAMTLMGELYERMTTLPDGIYKVNMYLFFLHNALSLQAVGQLSDQVDAALAYLSDYDLTDEALQKELAGTFQLLPFAERGA